MECHGAFLNENNKYMGGMGKFQILDYMKHYFYYKFEDYYKKVKCPVMFLPSKCELENSLKKQAMEKMSTITSNIVIKKTYNWIHAYSWMVNPEEASEYIKEFIQM